MTFLTFVIPTHSRPHTLERAIHSIAEQIGDHPDIRIKVVDDQSPVESVEILERLVGEFPFLSHRRMEVHGDYSTAFREMFCEAAESEWVWTFGDDDELLPGALSTVLSTLRDTDLQFLHVAEVKRASGQGGLHRGRLIDLCNEFGWIELTGFITGNIVRGARLASAAHTPRWNRYAKSSFVQSAALLEELAYDQCALLDLALINPQRDDNGMSEDTMKKWREQNIDLRYQFVGECIEAMFEDGILTHLLTPKFFRYLSYDFAGRFLSHWGGDYLNAGIVQDDMTWARIQKLGLFLFDEVYKKQFFKDCEDLRNLTILHSGLKASMEQMVGRITEITHRRNQFPYPYTFVGLPKPDPDETAMDHPV